MNANILDCRVFPFDPSCRGSVSIADKGYHPNNDQFLVFPTDEKANAISFITSYVNPEYVSSLQSLVFSFGMIG